MDALWLENDVFLISKDVVKMRGKLYFYVFLWKYILVSNPSTNRNDSNPWHKQNFTTRKTTWKVLANFIIVSNIFPVPMTHLFHIKTKVIQTRKMHGKITLATISGTWECRYIQEQCIVRGESRPFAAVSHNESLRRPSWWTFRSSFLSGHSGRCLPPLSPRRKMINPFRHTVYTYIRFT
jgi:hypothetical protein